MKIKPINKNDITDNYLKELFSTYQPENPSDDLKKQTMANVLHEWSLQPDISKDENKYETVIWIVVSVVSLVGLSFLLDHFYSITPEWHWDALSIDLSFISKIESTLQAIYQSVAGLPSIYVVTIIGGSIVLTIDQIVKRKVKMSRHQHFVF